MFLAIDLVSKFTPACAGAGPMSSCTRPPPCLPVPLSCAAFLRNVIAAFPYRLHTILTDNGTPFADQPRYRSGPTARYRLHAFDRACQDHGIAHKLTKPYHPWTNGQAERMNRTVKDATLKAFHYETLDSLKAHLDAFITAYNFAKHLNPSAGEHLSKPSAMPGLKTKRPSLSIRTISFRDHTPSRSVWSCGADKCTSNVAFP